MKYTSYLRTLCYRVHMIWLCFHGSSRVFIANVSERLSLYQQHNEKWDNIDQYTYPFVSGPAHTTV